MSAAGQTERSGAPLSGFSAQYGRARFTDGQIDRMDAAAAREAVRLMQFQLDEALGGGDIEFFAHDVQSFFKAFWKAGGRWNARSSGQVITIGESRILAHMIKGMERKTALFAAFYSDRLARGHEPEMKTIEVFVCYIRRVLAAAGFPVLTIYNKGYEIPQRRELEAMINAFAAGDKFDFSALLARAAKANADSEAGL